MIKDFIGSGIADVGANKNVVNILRLLTEDEDSIVYVPYNYVASKLDRSSDPRVHFPPKESGRPMEVITLTSNQERFNFSVTCLADVKVEYTSEDGKIELKDKRVWRTYSIIKDGKLNVDTMAAKLSNDAYDHLIDTGIVYLGDSKVDSNYEYDPTVTYTLNFKDVPLVSSNWARPNALNFHKMLLESQRIADTLKQARKLLKESKVNKVASNDENSDIYTESIQSYGSSVGTSVDCVTYTIIENKDYKPVKYTNDNSEDIEKDVKSLTSKLDNLRFKCACIKWSMESADNRRRNPYEWSNTYQKRAGTSKYYSDAIVDIDGVNYRLERCTYKKTV